MSVEPVWRLNLDLFQLQQTPYGLESLDGLAIQPTPGGDPEPKQPINPLDVDSIALEPPAGGVPEEAPAEPVLLLA